MFVSTNLFNHRSEQETGSHHTAPCRYWPHVAGRRKCGHLLGVAMCPHLAANYTNNAPLSPHSTVSTVRITDTGNNTSRGHVLLHVYIIYFIISTLHQTPDPNLHLDIQERNASEIQKNVFTPFKLFTMYTIDP